MKKASFVARGAGCDLIIGLGGGSAIDLAKGVASRPPTLAQSGTMDWLILAKVRNLRKDVPIRYH